MSEPLTTIIVGAGHRGVLYASYASAHPEELRVVGVADPDPVRREAVRQRFGIAPENCLGSAAELAARGRIADTVINGTMDADHVTTTLPLLEAGYDVLLEKPICPTQAELLQLLQTARRTGRRVCVGHVLRHAPFYAEIRRRVAAGEIGELITVNTTERVSYHHMAVVFVRGKWNQKATSNPMLMSKCCHDLDLIAWMKSGVRPQRVASLGGRMHFRPEKAPDGAGTRCLVDCPIERDCAYSARKHYLEQNRWGTYVWHCLEHLGQPTMDDKIRSLSTDNPHGRCVWKCDNDVVDHQSVIVEFADGCVASHTLTTGTAKPCRTIHLVGTKGEIEGSVEDGSFVVRFPDARPGHEFTETPVDLKVSMDMHGGGDLRLVGDFLRVVRGERPSLSTTQLEDSVYGHLIGFAADVAMEERRGVEIADIGGR
ncbi:MAG: Gfo/Idh/MocA family oxidoreductase [Lentisphaerae bacterium]|nr:Gfo/Idh/MocA family oxidoreductase [Lentisphaerota bacterium]